MECSQHQGWGACSIATAATLEGDDESQNKDEQIEEEYQGMPGSNVLLRSTPALFLFIPPQPRWSNTQQRGNNAV